MTYIVMQSILYVYTKFLWSVHMALFTSTEFVRNYLNIVIKNFQRTIVCKNRYGRMHTFVYFGIDDRTELTT